jgi:16S rRNA (cytosine967-C5)-methyltransferase
VSKSAPPPRRQRRPLSAAASPGPARAAAAEVLIAALTRKVPLESALGRHCAPASFSPRDRAFVHNLVLTTLRRLGEIEAAVASCLKQPLPKGAVHARIALALGACQILFLRTPAHAAVATSVALIAAGRNARFKGVVNAVLRRIARAPESFLAGEGAARANTPDWLWARWSAAFGEDTCRRIAEAHLVEPPLDLSVRAEPELWARRLNARVLPTGTVRVAKSAAVAQLDGYAEGAWWVQDAAAALPARLLGDVKGLAVFDLCAAPGGKTAQLTNAGANVVAVDYSEARVARLRDNLARLKLGAECVAADVLSWAPGRTADAVLLDAPCAATGTIRRHPDIPHVKKPADIAALTAAQAKLLRAAAALVRPGGVLVYCVCSLEPEEGPGQVARFLEPGVPFVREPVDAAAIFGQSQFVTAEGDLRTLPCHWPDLGGMDGFFAARLRRTGT